MYYAKNIFSAVFITSITNFQRTGIEVRLMFYVYSIGHFILSVKTYKGRSETKLKKKRNDDTHTLINKTRSTERGGG